MLERKQDESFEDYKFRRAADNKAVKLLNADSKSNSRRTGREIRRMLKQEGRLRGIGITRKASSKRPGAAKRASTHA